MGVRDLRLIAITVVAVILVGSVSGAAAGRFIISSAEQIKPGVIEKRHLSSKAKKKLRGAKGRAGHVGQAGPAGATGAVGATGTPGSAKAYALVRSDTTPPSFHPSYTKGFQSVTRTGSGEYCLVPSSSVDPARDPLLAAGTRAIGSEVGRAYWFPNHPAPCAGGYRVQVWDAADPPITTNNMDFTVQVP